MLEIYGKPENWRRFWVRPLTVGRLAERCPGPYDFVTIDTEGSSVGLLCEMPLQQWRCRVVCVEHNARTNHTARPGVQDYLRAKAYCSDHGLTVKLFDNGVNAIFARPVG